MGKNDSRTPLKVGSINFIKAADMPEIRKNTDMSQLVEAFKIALGGKPIPKAQAVSMKIAGAHKYTRYQLQKRLQSAGYEVLVREKDGTFFVVNAND